MGSRGSGTSLPEEVAPGAWLGSVVLLLMVVTGAMDVVMESLSLAGEVSLTRFSGSRVEVPDWEDSATPRVRDSWIAQAHAPNC